ncbi:MAG TPA: hypothetical protein VEH01_02775 [Nitrososphaerales archaeon]|nr:hypothetical protein [Nitrososphaerales archaeon]
MEKQTASSQSIIKECPECGAKTRLYRTPRGLRCAECVKRIDSGGLAFR